MASSHMQSTRQQQPGQGQQQHQAPTYRGYRRHNLIGYTFQVRNRYTCLEPLGRGAYGLVAKARDLITGRHVAIKQIGNLFRHNIDAKRTLREVKLLKHLGDHDNITKLLDMMTDPPDSDTFHTVYLVVQFYESDLNKIVIQSRQALTERHIRYFVYQILRALKYIHSANVIHRDLKPGNFFVNSDCELAIGDFGLSRGITLEVGELTEDVVTLWYRAPEILCSKGNYGEKADLWSVGVILGEFVCREPLLPGNAPHQQLQLIIASIGMPSDEDIEEVCSDSAARIIRNMPQLRPPERVSLIRHSASQSLLDLISNLLVFNPRKRLSLEEALAHPFFSEVRKPECEWTCPTQFNFEFERDYPNEMPREILQRLFLEEMQSIPQF